MEIGCDPRGDGSTSDEFVHRPGSAARPLDLLPSSLLLTPTSRWPTRLPEATVQAVMARPVPCLCERRPSDPAIRDGSKRVSIIIVTFNNLVYTKLCLEGLLSRTDYPSYEIIVVDNASHDGTADYLRGLDQQPSFVRVVFNSRNLGFAAANNQGLALATGDVFVLLNNDTLVPPGWITRLVQYLEDPAIGLVGPVTNRAGNEAQIDVPYHSYGEFLQFAEDYTQAHKGELFDIRMLAMFCAAMRRDVFERVGALDERFEVGLFEDDDYAMRVRQAGYRVICAEGAFVHHFGQASLGWLAATGEYGKLFHANRRRWEEKWRTSWQPYERRVNCSYLGLVERIRAAVDHAVPPDAAVIVVSKGDEELLKLGGRPAWHFPPSEDGSYAGHNPADSAAAIAQLEALQAKGGSFLVVPSTALWWLDYYADFRRHLETQSCQVLHQDDTCLIYALGTAEGLVPSRCASPIRLGATGPDWQETRGDIHA